jgi:hypothetical protein
MCLVCGVVAVLSTCSGAYDCRDDGVWGARRTRTPVLESGWPAVSGEDEHEYGRWIVWSVLKWEYSCRIFDKSEIHMYERHHSNAMGKTERNVESIV